MWELDYKESWALKNRCFWTVVLEKTLESPLDCKEIQPVHSEGDQSWVFIERADAETETAILWPPHAKSWLIGKDPDPGRDWGQDEKGTTEDEIAGWYHWLDAPKLDEFGSTPGIGDGQGGLLCCNSWDRKDLDMTEWLNWTVLRYEKMQQDEILSWTITRTQVSGDLWLLRPSPIIAHWVAYQQKPSSELGTSLSNKAGKKWSLNAPKVWFDLWPQGGHVNYKLAFTKSTEQQRHLPSASTESEPHDPIAVALQQLWSEALHAPGHPVRWVFRQLDFFF